jgi:hypothetical protein
MAKSFMEWLERLMRGGDEISEELPNHELKPLLTNLKRCTAREQHEVILNAAAKFMREENAAKGKKHKKPNPAKKRAASKHVLRSSSDEVDE